MKVGSPNSIPYVMILVISLLYNEETSLNLNRLVLHVTEKEITKGTINNMKITDQLFPSIKTEIHSDDVGSSAATPASETPLSFESAPL